MTLLRDPAGEKFDLALALRRLSPAAIEAFTGKSESHFRKVSHPERGLSFDLEDAARLGAALEASGEADPFPARYAETKRLALADRAAGPRTVPADPRDRLVDVLAEMGDVAEAVRLAHDPAGPGGAGRTHGEVVRLIGRVDQAAGALARLRNDLSRDLAPRLAGVPQ